ncbi:hypothetical protein [Haloarchaeobius iranensis]|uniref:hypothetical protein n=1 Tax=Haloarchaeobius iranensis TaxID=996166 RepID=UPI0011143A9B|nr:hypothetical protein [Haloarchaeobius iranensis]
MEVYSEHLAPEDDPNSVPDDTGDANAAATRGPPSRRTSTSDGSDLSRQFFAPKSGCGSSLGSFIDTERAFPDVERSEIRLEAEGLDVSSLRTRFQQSAPELSKSESASQYTDSPVESEDTDILDHVDELESRLSRFEETLTDREESGFGTHQVRVVDAGDGCLFLRLCNPDDVAQSLNHGDRVTIQFENTPD